MWLNYCINNREMDVTITKDSKRNDSVNNLNNRKPLIYSLKLKDELFKNFDFNYINKLNIEDSYISKQYINYLNRKYNNLIYCLSINESIIVELSYNDDKEELYNNVKTIILQYLHDYIDILDGNYIIYECCERI